MLSSKLPLLPTSSRGFLLLHIVLRSASQKFVYLKRVTINTLIIGHMATKSPKLASKAVAVTRAPQRLRVTIRLSPAVHCGNIKNWVHHSASTICACKACCQLSFNGSQGEFTLGRLTPSTPSQLGRLCLRSTVVRRLSVPLGSYGHSVNATFITQNCYFFNFANFHLKQFVFRKLAKKN